MTWFNSDNLFVKFGVEEGISGRGGQYSTEADGSVNITFTINYTDMLSASNQILGAATGTSAGSYGIVIPKGLRIETVKVIAETAFTSSGTIGSSTFQVGGVKSSDRSTSVAAGGFTTSSFVGSSIDAAGERTELTVGSTGAGTLIGTTLADNTLIVCANTAHGSHPYTAGKAIVTIRGYFPV